MDQASYIFSQTVKNTDQGSIHIQKRTDKGHGADVDPGSGAVKENIAKKRTKKKKACRTKSSKKQAAGTCLSCNMADSFAEAKSLHFCHRWHKHNRGGICDSGWKKNQRESHSCKHSVNAERIRRGQAIKLKPLGNQDYLNASKQCQKHPVQGKRKRGMTNFPEPCCKTVRLKKGILFFFWQNNRC